jgi:hypothetical protein
VGLLSKDLFESKVRLCVDDVHSFYTKVYFRGGGFKVKSSFLAGIFLFDTGKVTGVSILNSVRSELKSFHSAPWHRMINNVKSEEINCGRSAAVNQTWAKELYV